jgi:gag-polyprotein putative aspartyl protease
VKAVGKLVTGLHQGLDLIGKRVYRYIGYLGINGVLICCIMDTGAHRTIIDSAMAKALGLRVKTDDLWYRKFSVPGSEAVHSYAGVVEGVTTVRIGESLEAKVENMRVINHPHPFLLLGADVLSGGRDSSSWNFTGMKVHTTQVGEV